ncbi:hypothetical protein Tco_1384867 [Tanacetum coccineum]
MGQNSVVLAAPLVVVLLESLKHGPEEISRRPGRNSYARALIEVSAANELMESIVIAIPIENGLGHSLETIDVEYEWQPPRCATCKIFDHYDSKSPKLIKVDVSHQQTNDGFVEVTRRNGKGKQPFKSRQIDGIWLSKGAVNQPTNTNVFMLVPLSRSDQLVTNSMTRITTIGSDVGSTSQPVNAGKGAANQPTNTNVSMQVPLSRSDQLVTNSTTRITTNGSDEDSNTQPVNAGKRAANQPYF